MKKPEIPQVIDNWAVRQQVHTAACQLFSAKVIAGLVNDPKTAQAGLANSFMEAEYLMILCYTDLKFEQPMVKIPQ